MQDFWPHLLALLLLIHLKSELLSLHQGKQNQNNKKIVGFFPPAPWCSNSFFFLQLDFTPIAKGHSFAAMRLPPYLLGLLATCPYQAHILFLSVSRCTLPLLLIVFSAVSSPLILSGCSPISCIISLALFSCHFLPSKHVVF